VLGRRLSRGRGDADATTSAFAAVILGLHSKQLTERGTEVALLEYAAGAEAILGHQSRIFVPASADRIVPEVRRRVEQRFELILYDSPAEIACDALYVIKRGHPSRITSGLPELNHAFFDASHPHGHRFATVSRHVARLAARHVRGPRGRTLRLPLLRKPPVVPHIVTLPDLDDDFRAELAIPDDAVVFGRHGGFGTFNLQFVKDAIETVVDQRSDVWFVFAQTRRFCDHPRVLHLPLLVERADVRRFVNTCDYMIHAHTLGESFGLAVAEFAYAGIPVLTYLRSPRLAQLEILGRSLTLGYNGYEDVLARFSTLQRRGSPVPTDVPDRYSPERVMHRFETVFLS
jgi:hypothetical protein